MTVEIENVILADNMNSIMPLIYSPSILSHQIHNKYVSLKDSLMIGKNFGSMIFFLVMLMASSTRESCKACVIILIAGLINIRPKIFIDHLLVLKVGWDFSTCLKVSLVFPQGSLITLPWNQVGIEQEIYGQSSCYSEGSYNLCKATIPIKLHSM